MYFHHNDKCVYFLKMSVQILQNLSESIINYYRETEYQNTILINLTDNIIIKIITTAWECGLGGIVTFKRDIVGSNRARVETIFQTVSTPSSYSTCLGLSIKWTARRLVTDSGTKCAWVIKGCTNTCT